MDAAAKKLAHRARDPRGARFAARQPARLLLVRLQQPKIIRTRALFTVIKVSAANSNSDLKIIISPTYFSPD